ncbi:MAG: transposase, partial [Acidovorax sp.]|nr:transposase [Acidovorax sp.]
MTDAKKNTRRRYDAELKQQILAQCAEPGASVASIAMSHGINANVVHKWRRLASGALPAVATPAFVPV